MPPTTPDRSKSWLYRAPGTSQNRLAAAVLVLAWLVLVLFMAANHVVWRDEVRALTKALEGADFVAMVGGLRTEGHPALWYILLRAAHEVFARPEVIQIVALVIATAATLLLVLKSPFRWPVLAVLLLGHFSVFEFSVMARNYGISMLLLFTLAALYERHRNRGVLMGVVLFLLASTNVHSVVLAGAFMLFWLADLVTDPAVRWGRAIRVIAVNGAIAGAGVVACVLTVYPPIQDAAVVDRPGGITARLLLEAVALPAEQFGTLLFATPDVTLPGFWQTPHMYVVMSLILFGSTLGLLRRPGAAVAALAALAGFALLFAAVYPAQYRHTALWLAFLITMYWVAAYRPGPARPSVLARLLRPVMGAGTALFLLIMAVQIPYSGLDIARAAGFGPPFSRSRDLGKLIGAHPELAQSVIIADPDYLVEPLSYYVSNPVYLLRQQQYGRFALFINSSRLKLSLDDVLASARMLRADTGKPVVILLAAQLDAALPPQTYAESYNWQLLTTPDQVRTFQAATRMLASFAPAVSNESYDVYVLD